MTRARTFFSIAHYKAAFLAAFDTTDVVAIIRVDRICRVKIAKPFALRYVMQPSAFPMKRESASWLVADDEFANFTTKVAKVIMAIVHIGGIDSAKRHNRRIASAEHVVL